MIVTYNAVYAQPAQFAMACNMTRLVRAAEVATTAAALLGPTIAVVGGGIGTILVVALAALIWPEVRHLGRLSEPREPEPP